MRMAGFNRHGPSLAGLAMHAPYANADRSPDSLKNVETDHPSGHYTLQFNFSGRCNFPDCPVGKSTAVRM